MTQGHAEGCNKFSGVKMQGRGMNHSEGNVETTRKRDGGGAQYEAHSPERGDTWAQVIAVPSWMAEGHVARMTKGHEKNDNDGSNGNGMTQGRSMTHTQCRM